MAGMCLGSSRTSTKRPRELSIDASGVGLQSCPRPLAPRSPANRSQPKTFGEFHVLVKKRSETTHVYSHTNSSPTMAKRPADSEQEQEAIKNGERPMEIDQNEAGEFEDEFEDEFESEDEILEAGVDGRPDEEREAEERERTLPMSQTCAAGTDNSRRHGCRPRHIHTRPAQTVARRNPQP